MIKDIWNAVTGNYRYIKYDGSEFHRGKWTSILDRPETKVGLACFAFNCVSVFLLNNDVSDIINGELSHVSKLTKDLIVEHTNDLIIGGAVCTFIFANMNLYSNYPKKDKAIDTYGTDLSRAELSLKDYEMIKTIRNRGVFLGALGAVFELISLNHNSYLDVDNVMLMTLGYMAFERNHKILKGDYVICDEPPKKRQTQTSKSTLLGGIFSPN